MQDMIQQLAHVPDADRLVRAYQDASWWSREEQTPMREELRRSVGEELVVLRLLEREIRELCEATENRWDGRSSAFQQADILAADDRDKWIDSLRRLADLMDQVRSIKAPSGSPRDLETPAETA
jgi:hypothetical protein